MSLTNHFFHYNKTGSPASSRRPAPFMGDAEIEFLAIWRAAWDPIQAHIASPMFVEQLGPHPSAMTMSALVDSFIDQAGSWLDDTGRILQRMADPSVQKAVAAPENPFKVGTSSWVRWQRRNLHTDFTIDPTLRYAQVAKQLTLSMIKGITEPMKKSLRGIISRGFDAGKTPAEIAQEVSLTVGLGDRWMKAVGKLRDNMISRHIPEKIMTRRLAKYSAELLQKRGVMVARTEMARAQNAGVQEAWQVESDAGHLDGLVMVKYWVARSGACEECAEASDSNAIGVPRSVKGLGTSFDTVYGNALYPPLHPHCRCYVRYETRAL